MLSLACRLLGLVALLPSQASRTLAAPTPPVDRDAFVSNEPLFRRLNGNANATAPGCSRGPEDPFPAMQKSGPGSKGHWAGACGHGHGSLHVCPSSSQGLPSGYDCAPPGTAESFWDRTAAVAGSAGATVTAVYGGGTANNMFQYAFGHRLASVLGAKLVPHSYKGENTGPLYWDELGKAIGTGPDCNPTAPGQLIVSDRDHLPVLPLCAQLRAALVDKPRCIRADGFFQDFAYLRGHKETFRGLFKADLPAALPEADEVVVHLRVCRDATQTQPYPLGSGYGELPRAYYDRVLSTVAAASKISLVGPPSCDASMPLVAHLMKTYGAVLHNGPDPLSDYAYLLSAKRLVLSPSTFGWWAAWLSEAREVHYPLDGLFAHQRTLNYPKGPAGHATGLGPAAQRLKCEAIFQAPGGQTKSLVVDEDRYFYHSVLADRFFGRYDRGTDTFAWDTAPVVAAVGSAVPDTAVPDTAAAPPSPLPPPPPTGSICAPPPVRDHLSQKRIKIGPRTAELECFAGWQEGHNRSGYATEDTGAMASTCCDLKRPPGEAGPVLLFPRSHVEAVLQINLDLNQTKPMDFNFMGRVKSKQAPATRERLWSTAFARTHFTPQSVYIDTTTAHYPDGYEPLGVFDESIEPSGLHAFKPMGAMGAEKLGAHCAMATCDMHYYSILARSKFTLAPAGDQPWSQRFFEAILAGSIPILKSTKHSGHNVEEQRIGYWYLLEEEYEARLAKDGQVPHCPAWAEHNLELFLKRQTLVEDPASLVPNRERCAKEAEVFGLG